MAHSDPWTPTLDPACVGATDAATVARVTEPRMWIMTADGPAVIVSRLDPETQAAIRAECLQSGQPVPYSE
jgi:hypothetical protein